MKGIVVDKVTPDMELFREESFGPQVSITRVKNADEAVKLANDTDYGLSAAIHTRDIAKGIELAKRIESGICHINGPTVADEPQMPFGGVKASGYGRFGGRAGWMPSRSCGGSRSSCRRGSIRSERHLGQIGRATQAILNDRTTRCRLRSPAPVLLD